MKKTIHIVIICLPMLFAGILAQAQLDKADNYYEIEKYRLALKYYKRAYKKDTTDLYLAYQMANCYLKMNTDRSKALPYLYQAYDTNPKAYLPHIFLDMGIAHFHNHEFIEAIRYLEYYRNYVPTEKHAIIERYIDYSLSADTMVLKPINVEFINLGKTINSRSDDFNPFVTRDDTRMLFSSESDLRSIRVFMSKRKNYNEDWEQCKPAGKTINQSNDQIISGLSPDGDALFLFFNNYDPENNDIVMSNFNGEDFDEAKVLTGKVNTNKREEGACITLNRDTLFFASNRPEGFGGLDIYMTRRLPTGNWGEPVNLGASINSPYDDNYPSISENGKVLYFSSKGHSSMGGYDLYSSEWNSVFHRWSKPHNLGYPINTTYDNNNISILDNGRYAYVAANRPEGYGQLDIYKVIFNEKAPELLVFSGKVKLQHAQFPDSTIDLNNSDVDFKVSVYDMKLGEYYGVYNCSRSTGKYIIAIPPGEYEWEILSPLDEYEDLIIPMSVVESTFEGMQIHKDLTLKRKQK